MREGCCHVLHVEDDAGDAAIIERMMGRRHDVRLTHVDDGESALAYLRGTGGGKPVDVILLDLKLRRMQGTEVLRAIRSDRNCMNLPVIVLTSTRDHGTIDRCHEIGIDGFLAKDDDAAALGGRLGRILETWCQEAGGNAASNDSPGASDAGIPPSRPGPKRRSTDTPIPSDTPRILIVDDSTPDAAMMVRYLESLGAAIQTASESGEAEALLREQPVDIILLDYRMPGMSGLDYLEIVRVAIPMSASS